MEDNNLEIPLISKTQECPICQVNNSSYTIPQCQHNFCESCLNTYLNIKITEGNVLVINCPETDCKQQLTNSQIQELTSEDLFSKYTEFYNKKSLESNIYFRWCPLKQCKGYDLYTNSYLLTCNQCSHKFCFLCSDPWHSNKKCKEIEKDFSE